MDDEQYRTKRIGGLRFADGERFAPAASSAALSAAPSRKRSEKFPSFHPSLAANRSQLPLSNREPSELKCHLTRREQTTATRSNSELWTVAFLPRMAEKRSWIAGHEPRIATWRSSRLPVNLQMSTVNWSFHCEFGLPTQARPRYSVPALGRALNTEEDYMRFDGIRIRVSLLAFCFVIAAGALASAARSQASAARA